MWVPFRRAISVKAGVDVDTSRHLETLRQSCFRRTSAISPGNTHKIKITEKPVLEERSEISQPCIKEKRNINGQAMRAIRRLAAAVFRTEDNNNQRYGAKNAL